MTSATFRVVTRGLQADYSPELATRQLTALFKCSEEQIAPLLRNKPATVKKGLTEEAATKYAQALERCGCVCAIEGEPATPLNQQQMHTVIPVLRRVKVQDPGPDPVVVEPFAGDLEVVFQTEPEGKLVRQSELGASMLSRQKLYEFAVWNLYKRVQPHMRFQQMATERADGTAGLRCFMYVETGDSLEAASLLLWPVWQTVAQQVKGPLRIAVPKANTCLFCSADDALAFPMMSDVASETWAEAGADRLSGFLYSVDATGRVTVAENGNLLRAAPAAPSLPPRPSAQLLTATVHAYASDAALLTLSEERLRRLQPKLFDPSRWGREAERVEWLERIRNTMARGDGRAAVVVNAAAGVVASYTDELDCVVLLKFDPALGQAHGWQDGTRLLSANGYVQRADGVARDLQPGPADTGNWGNVWPLIADLLTDDEPALSARKRRIGEAEWTRAWELGRRALAARGAARDGRPMGSAMPAPPPVPVNGGATAAGAASPAAATAPARKSAARRRPARRDGGFGGCVKDAGIFAFCALAVWGAASHVAEMPHDGLFYLACFGIVLFGALGLACLKSAADYVRGA